MHHANLIVGSRLWAQNIIPEAERTPGSDVVWYDKESLTIDDARTMARESSLRPVERKYRSFVVFTETMLPPTQNALLKLLEEPSPETVFYFIVPREDVLLPTLRSRFHLMDREVENGAVPEFEKFKSMSYRERLACVESRLNLDDDAWVKEIVRGFEIFASKQAEPGLLEDAMQVSAYSRSPGCSLKMLLEHIALTL